MISDYPVQEAYDPLLLKNFDRVKEVVSAVRNLRKEKNISFKESLKLFVMEKEEMDTSFDGVIQKLVNVSGLERVESKVDNTLTFRVGANEFFIPFLESIDLEAERMKLEKELEYNKGFLASVQKKLSNERFVSNAPEKVIENERKKEADALAKIEVIEQSLRSL